MIPSRMTLPCSLRHQTWLLAASGGWANPFSNSSAATALPIKVHNIIAIQMTSMVEPLFAGCRIYLGGKFFAGDGRQF